MGSYLASLSKTGDAPMQPMGRLANSVVMSEKKNQSMHAHKS